MDRINCLIVDDEPRAREVLQLYLQDFPELHLVATCKNAMEAIRYMADHSIDLIFLDIQMPEISGIAFAKSLKPEVKIIFTTAFRNYAMEGFELNAVDYLLKPISPERFQRSIEKLKSLWPQRTSEQTHSPEAFLIVRSERKMIKIPQSAISYVESLGDYVKIHVGEIAHLSRETISNIQGNLDDRLFIRVHRSFLVNSTRINSFTKEYVEISGQKLPISRSYRKEVTKRLTAIN